MKLLIISLIYLCLNFLLFDVNINTRLFYFLFYFILNMDVEFAVIFVIKITCNINFMQIYDTSRIHFIIIIFIKTLFLIILKIIQHLFLNTIHYLDNKLFKGFFVLPIATLCFHISIFYSYLNMKIISIYKIILLLGCCMLLFSNIYILYLLDKISKIIYRANELELIQVKNNMEHVHYEILEKKNYEHIQYMHNMKFYLKTIAVLAQKAKINEIVNIIKEMEIEINNIEELTYCNHNILNALLCERESEAKRMGIKFDVYVEPNIFLSFIRDFDIIAMVGNLVDNALEAAARCIKNKFVIIQIFATDGNFIMFRIENSYLVKPKKNEKGFITTKKDKYFHGFGIENVKEVASKYGGILYSEIENDVFTASLVLARK